MKHQKKTALMPVLLLLLLALLVSGLYLTKHIVCRNHIESEQVIYPKSDY